MAPLIIKDQVFELGDVVLTQGVMDLVHRTGVNVVRYVERHAKGDWGDLVNEDKAENEFSLKNGLRLFSAYELTPDRKIWIITEADRSVTTILLPEEY